MASFVGRERELKLLEQALDDALLTDGRLVTISGEPGIGKTRLSEELAARAVQRGFVAAFGRTWEGEGTPAYFPWLQALRVLARSLGARFEHARAQAPELSSLFDAKLGASAAVDPSEARFRLFDALTELLRQLSAEMPLLVVLEDLHAADLSTLELLHFVARNLRGAARVLLIATERDTGTLSPASHQQLLLKIAREGNAIALPRLNREALAEWVEQSGQPAPSVDRVLSVSEGNPLFVTELLAAAAKGSRVWASADELPLGIREAIRGHLAVLPKPTYDALAVASVLGREFSPTLVARLMGGAKQELQAALASGVLLQAQAPAEAAEPRLCFTHVLMKDELYASLTPERRAELHRALGAELSDPVLAAPHWLSGARPDDAAPLGRAVVAAMADACARFAFEDAALLGERALATGALGPRGACELGVLVSEAWQLSGQHDAARKTGAAAAEAAQKLGDAQLLARAALTHATELSVGNRYEPSVHWLKAAYQLLPDGDSGLRAQVMARLSLALLPAEPHEHDHALRLAHDSIAMARRLGDDETLFAALRFTRTTPAETEDAATRFALNAETIELAKKLGRVPLVAALLGWQVAARIELGDIDGALREAETMERLLSAYRQPTYRYRWQLVRAMLADLEGRFAEADALGRNALKSAEEHGVFGGIVLFLTQRIGFLYTRADDAGWAEHEPKALALLGKDPLFQVFRCTFDAACGRSELVRESLGIARQVPLHTLPDAAGLATACAVAGVTEHAQAFYDFLAQESRKGPWQFGPGRVTSMGPRALTLGRLALLLGREDDARGHFEAALALAKRVRSRPYVAQSELELARLLAKSDPATAHERAETARSIAAEVGMQRVETRAQALLDELHQPDHAPPAKAQTNDLVLERNGETWRLGGLGRSLLLKDAKGLFYLDQLVRAPCREIHVLTLAGARDEGDAGPLLDERAKRQYRARAEALRAELAEAENHADPGRVARAQSELSALTRELSRAFGLGDRERRGVSPTERARINVQRRVRDAIARVSAVDAELGQ
ncbi:MAG TPA: AAA family ATPase, partial [Polyangiaceae bacterium]|nr:AAA family ATPase [Polyangiaceae bacterium]